MEFTNVIYPTGMKTHPSEELWIDDASKRTFKELFPSMYKEGWAFIGIYCEEDGKTFINDEDAEKYLKEKYGLFNLHHSYAKGYHFYSEWQREAYP